MLFQIPYGVTRQEMRQLFARSSLAGDNPVHIIMERSTGKTMECYVEFTSENEAEAALSRLNRGSEEGNGPRLGARHLEISRSSPSQLQKALFPLTKCIRWDGTKPVQLPTRPDEPWSTGFNGFLTNEEISSNLRHALYPGRVCLIDWCLCYDDELTFLFLS